MIVHMAVSGGRRQPSSNLVLLMIVVFALIDAILIAHLHARFVVDHGYDVRPRHPAVAKPAPP
jgi:hypothetical protein